MGQITQMLVPGIAGAISASILIPWIIRRHRARIAGHVVREFHHGPSESIPRVGGVVLAVVFGLTALGIYLLNLADPKREQDVGVIVLGALAMFGLGFWDDLKPLGARRKLLGQVLIACAVWYMGIGIDGVRDPLGGGVLRLGMWSSVVTVLWLVALTNLINLIDGLDGLAAGLSLMLIGLLAYLQFQNGVIPFLCMALVGALLVFLRYNFPPAKIYLGDGGAYLLGFFIAGITILTSQKGTVAAALIAPLFVLTLPIIDVSLAILRRGLKGLPIFRPDRGHIHHKLLESGMSRRRAVLSLYAFTLLFLGLGLVFWWGEGRMLPILLGFGTLCVLLIAGQFDFSREWFAVGRVLGNSVGMRDEVGYALSVTRWLHQESRRVQSMDEFWRLMTFAAQRLGFTSLMLELPDGCREWSIENPPVAFHHRRFNLKNAGAGVIDLRSRVCNHLDPEHPVPRHCGRSVPCVGDRRVFGVVCDLFVEVWHQASHEFRQTAPELQFDTRFNRFQPPGSPMFKWTRRLRGLGSDPRIEG